MTETELVINDLDLVKLILCNPQTLTPEMCIRIGQVVTNAISLLKKQEPIKVADGRPRCRFECGNCGTEFAFVYNYCPSCGRKVKWNATN